MFSKQQKVYIDTNNPFALGMFVKSLEPLVSDPLKEGYKSIIFLCIGTDRSTGDSLGPIVGYKLSGEQFNNVYIEGTLDNPVHAGNLAEKLEYIKHSYPSPFIVAIDACLGNTENVGHISVGNGSIKPGSSVRKDLEEVGDVYVTGIVNFKGMMDFLVLQNTRLGVVMKMADIISAGIKYILWTTLREWAILS